MLPHIISIAVISPLNSTSNQRSRGMMFTPLDGAHFYVDENMGSILITVIRVRGIGVIREVLIDSLVIGFEKKF